MTNKNLTDPNVRKMLAGDLLAIHKLKVRFPDFDRETLHWMQVQANTCYHRIQLQIDNGRLTWLSPYSEGRSSSE